MPKPFFYPMPVLDSEVCVHSLGLQTFSSFCRNWLDSGWINFHSFKDKASFTWAQEETPNSCEHHSSSPPWLLVADVALLIVSINKSISSPLHAQCHGNPRVNPISLPPKATLRAEMIYNARGKASCGKSRCNPSPPAPWCSELLPLYLQRWIHPSFQCAWSWMWAQLKK